MNLVCWFVACYVVSKLATSHQYIQPIVSWISVVGIMSDAEWNKAADHLESTWAHLIKKISSYQYWVLIIKIRRSYDRLIFMMEIPYLERPFLWRYSIKYCLVILMAECLGLVLKHILFHYHQYMKYCMLIYTRYIFGNYVARKRAQFPQYIHLVPWWIPWLPQISGGKIPLTCYKTTSHRVSTLAITYVFLILLDIKGETRWYLGSLLQTCHCLCNLMHC